MERMHYFGLVSYSISSIGNQSYLRTLSFEVLNFTQGMMKFQTFLYGCIKMFVIIVLIVRNTCVWKFATEYDEVLIYTYMENALCSRSACSLPCVYWLSLAPAFLCNYVMKDRSMLFISMLKIMWSTCSMTTSTCWHELPLNHLILCLSCNKWSCAWYLSKLLQRMKCSNSTKMLQRNQHAVIVLTQKGICGTVLTV